MARRAINKTWTPEDVNRLISLAESGATVLRAAAALGRPATAVQNKARQLGKRWLAFGRRGQLPEALSKPSNTLISS